MKKILLWCTLLITSWAFAQGTTQIGSGTAGSTYFPNYYLYNYTYTQTIYTAAEMTAQGAVAGDISKIRFLPKSSVATTNWKDWEVYMLGTTKASFTGTSDWVPVTSMTKVFDSTLPANVVANAWMELSLSAPFAWNGTDNIVVAVYEKTPTYGSSPTWAGYTSTAGKGIYKYQDAVFTSATPGTGTLTVATTVIAQIQFYGTVTPGPSVAPACTTISAPANNATGVSRTPAISWGAIAGVNGATSYEIKIGTTAGGSDVLASTDVGNVTSYTVPAANILAYGTTYFATITPKNSIGSSTGCTSSQFTTVNIACPTVTAPTAGAGGQSLTPTITWSAITDASSYTLKVGTTPGGSDVINNVDLGNVTSYTFATPLNNSTNYYYTVNSVKGTNTSASCTERMFTTICNPYTVPYFEGFESGYTDATAIVGCLSQASVTGTYNWSANKTATTYNRTPRTGSWNAMLQYSNERWLFIPIQLTGGTAYQVSLYARQDAATGANIVVSYGNIATAAGMTNAIVPSTNIINGNYQKISGNFTPATTGTYYVGIKGYATSSPYYISLDDISIGLVPTCIEPTALASSMITTTGATLSWTAPATAPANGYDVYYSTVNTAPTAATTPTTTSTTTTANLTGLSGNTQYFVWVRSNCSTSDKSIWTALPSFTTACTATNIPYSENFESVAPPALPNCTTTQNAGSGNNWVTASAPGGGFTTKTLKYGYNASAAANAWFYTPGLNLIKDTEYKITFDYGNNSTGYTEKLKVAYGTAADYNTMTNPIADLPTINQNAVQNGSFTFTPTTSGVYYVGFNAYSGVNQFNLMVDNINIIVNVAGTSEIANAKEGVKVYPNPFTDVLNISDVRNVKSIAIVDASGRLVKTIDKPAAQLQLGDLASGMYILTLHYNNGTTKTVKAMKK